MHEKEKYELFLKIKEQAVRLKRCQTELEAKDRQIRDAKHQHAIELSKKDLVAAG